MALKPKFDITVLKKLLRVVAFNMPFKNKFVQVILGDRNSGYMPDEKDLDGMATAIGKMKEDSKNFGDTTFFITHDLIKFRPFNIESLKKKIMFIVVGDETWKPDDVEFKKIELEVKSAFESAKLSTTRVVVLRHPVELVSGDTPEEKQDEEVRKQGVDTKPPR